MFDLLKDVLVEKLKISPIEVTLDATKEDLDLDSLAAVELAVILSKEHGIDIPDDELADAKTLADIVALMDSHRTLL